MRFALQIVFLTFLAMATNGQRVWANSSCESALGGGDYAQSWHMRTLLDEDKRVRNLVLNLVGSVPKAENIFSFLNASLKRPDLFPFIERHWSGEKQIAVHTKTTESLIKRLELFDLTFKTLGYDKVHSTEDIRAIANILFEDYSSEENSLKLDRALPELEDLLLRHAEAKGERQLLKNEQMAELHAQAEMATESSAAQATKSLNQLIKMADSLKGELEKDMYEHHIFGYVTQAWMNVGEILNHDSDLVSNEGFRQALDMLAAFTNKWTRKLILSNPNQAAIIMSSEEFHKFYEAFQRAIQYIEPLKNHVFTQTNENINQTLSRLSDNSP